MRSLREKLVSTLVLFSFDQGLQIEVLAEFWLFFESAKKAFKSPTFLQEKSSQMLCFIFEKQFHNWASFRCFPELLFTTFLFAGPKFCCWNFLCFPETL